jgi:hypothetical protein
MTIVKRQISDPTNDYDIAAGTAIVGGGGTVAITTGLKSIISVRADSRTANRAYVSGVLAGAVTVTGTAADAVDWIAIGLI